MLAMSLRTVVNDNMHVIEDGKRMFVIYLGFEQKIIILYQNC